MIVLRLTKMLAKRLSLTVAPQAIDSTNPYADWCVHQFSFVRHRFLIAVNTRSLLPVVMPARGATDRATLITRVLQQVEMHLRDRGWSELFEEFILPEASAVILGTIDNRSLQSSINDLIFLASAYLESGLSVSDVNFRLGEAPMGYLEMDHPRMVFPRMGTGHC
jgi:hypothetical protein